MPREPAFTNEEFRAIAVSYNDRIFSEEGKLMPATDQVWVDIASRLSNKRSVTPKYVWVYVHQNRHGANDFLRKERGILPDTPEEEEEEGIFNSDLSDETNNTGMKSSPEPIVNKPKESFIVHIPPDDWKGIKPVEQIRVRSDRKSGSSIRLVLPPNKWEPVIINLLWMQHKLTCPYTFKRADVYGDKYNRRVFVSIAANCRECGADAEGTILDEPAEGQPCVLHWRSPNTCKVAHQLKRPLRGEERQEVASQVYFETASIYRQKYASENMELYDLEPPTLRSGSVVRKAKQEFREKKLGIEKGDDPITSVNKMRNRHPYLGCIHYISLYKVVVIYFSPTQLLVYRNYCKQNYSILSLDATGSLVKKIKREEGLSGNIFLYEGVVHTGRDQIPVVQMLSEKHDTNTILYWLNEWNKAGAPCPNEIVCDSSLALLGAIAKSFGKSVDLKSYMQMCFDLLNNKEIEIPPCFIRKDIAHIFHAAARWKVWGSQPRSRVKKFYMHCLALLTQCEDLISYSEILEHILFVSLSETDGADDSGKDVPSEISRKFLLRRIAAFGEDEHESSGIKQYDVGLVPDWGSPVSADDTSIVDWLGNLVKKVTEKITSSPEGTRVNAYYSGDVAKNFRRVSQDFVLWSSVMVKTFGSPRKTASSASVEGYFAEFKTGTLKNERAPMSLPSMVATHLNSIDGSMKIAAAHQEERNRNVTQAHKVVDTDLTDEGNDPDDIVVDFLTEQEALRPKNVTELSTDSFANTRADEHISFPGEDVSNGMSPEESTLPTNQDSTQSSVFVTELGNLSDGEKTKKSSEKRKLDADQYSSPHDLRNEENWRGKGRSSKYLRACPEIEAIDQENILKGPSNILLLNGNLCPYLKVNKTMTRVDNTCPFDALCQGMALAYIEHLTYRNFVNGSTNLTLKTARELALKGAIQSTYILRIKALSEVLAAKKINLSTMQTRKSVRATGLQYECYGSASNLYKSIMNDVPSVVMEESCPVCGYNSRYGINVVDVNSNIIIQSGFSAIAEAISSCSPTHDICSNCKGSPLVYSIVETGQHLLVDVEPIPSLSEKKNYKLYDFPPNIVLCGASYILVGIVAYRPGHFVCYGRRATGQWNFYDDKSSCKKEERNLNLNTAEAEPNVLFFIRDK